MEIDQFLLRDEKWEEQTRKIKERVSINCGSGYINILTVVMVFRILSKCTNCSLSMCIILHVNYASKIKFSEPNIKLHDLLVPYLNIKMENTVY